MRQAAISAILLCTALTASARTRPRYGGTLRVEIRGDAWASDGLARRLVLDTLTTTGPRGKAQPALALQWNSQDSDRLWDFHLRPGVRFQDGLPLTADAVAASLKATCSPGPGAEPSAPCPWKAVNPAGPSVVVVTTNTSLPDLPELLAQTRFAISRQDAAGALDGTGPFRVADSRKGVVILTAYDGCWQGRPFLDSIRILPHRSTRDQWLDLSVGRADVVQVPPELLGQAAQQHLSVLVSRPVDLLALTMAPQGPFAVPQVRHAAALAVDRSALFNVVFQKEGEITASLLPQSLSGFAFLFPVTRDLDRARALLAGASLPPAALSAPRDGALRLAAERLMLNLNEAGFHIRMASPDSSSALALRRLRLEASAPRPALDEMLDALGQNAAITGTGPLSLWKAQSSVLRNYSVVPLLWLPRAWAVGPTVRGLRLSPDGSPLLANASLEAAK